MQITSGTNDIVLATRHGLSIRFHEQDVREMGRDTTGVKGIELGPRDEVIGMVVIKREATLLVVAERGIGKCSPIDDYRVQKRGGKGIITIHRTEKTGDAVSIMEVLPEDELMLMTKQGILIRMPVKGIRVAGRNTQGVKLVNLDEKDLVMAVARVVPEDEEEGDASDSDVEPVGVDGDERRGVAPVHVRMKWPRRMRRGRFLPAIAFPPSGHDSTFSPSVRFLPAVLAPVNRPTEPSLPIASIGPLGMTVELPVSTPELEETLHRDRESLVRDALLWQRWVRYAGLLASSSSRSCSASARTATCSSRWRRSRWRTCSAWRSRESRCAAQRRCIASRIPALLVTADVLALASARLADRQSRPSRRGSSSARCSSCSSPSSTSAARWASTRRSISALAYVVVALVLPPQAPGCRAGWRDVAFTVGLFALVSAVLISAYGSFRERMNRLRLFCKLVEDGDLHPVLDLGMDKRPDDLTLLAQSFDAMRARLGEQIGTDPLTGLPQPPRPRDAAARGAAPGQAAREHARHPRDRSRPLQGDQRHARPSVRRSRADRISRRSCG